MVTMGSREEFCVKEKLQDFRGEQKNQECLKAVKNAKKKLKLDESP